MTTLSYNDLAVDLHPTGARTTALRFHGRDLILPTPQAFDPLGVWADCGAIVGPVANRITTGPHVTGWSGPDGGLLLHGDLDGADGAVMGGIQHQDWTLEKSGARHATFTLELPAGSDGFSANRRLQATYSLPRANTLNLVLTAETDAPTVMTLTHHPYWSLGPDTGTADHRLQIFADHMLPIDEHTRPTGDVLAIAGTDWDFNIPKTFPPGTPPLDNCFCLGSKRRNTPRPAAFLEAPDGWAMELWSTEPGLIVFDGRITDRMGLMPYAGCCLEPQLWPEAPKYRHFPKIDFLPGQVSRTEIEYRFKVGSGKMRQSGTSRGL